MFHMPILASFSVYPVGARGSLTWAIVMIGGTFLIVATIGRFCEQSKGYYKRGFLFVWEQLPRKAPPPAVVHSPSID